MTRTWALGDIHANATALRAALALVDPSDQLVILGDLFTYGPDPEAVLELVATLVEGGAILLLGHHDELYLDLLAGESRGYHRLPTWIRASVDWTLERLDPAVLLGLPFVREHVVDGMLFGYANPWGTWRPLHTREDHHDAANALRERWLKVGVFGHGPHGSIVEIPGERGFRNAERREVQWVSTGAEDVLLIHTGAVGLPRNPRARSTLVEIAGDAQACEARVHVLSYEVATHLRRVAALPLSPDVRQRLASFFRPRPRD